MWDCSNWLFFSCMQSPWLAQWFRVFRWFTEVDSSCNIFCWDTGMWRVTPSDRHSWDGQAWKWPQRKPQANYRYARFKSWTPHIDFFTLLSHLARGRKGTLCGTLSGHSLTHESLLQIENQCYYLLLMALYIFVWQFTIFKLKNLVSLMKHIWAPTLLNSFST